jgi:starch-binding outer membrane protein, SusD/RagB family
MNAEAKIKLGKNGDAPFNEVRRRAQMDEITNVTFEQVIDERRMEFVCEWGERYNDLCRTGLAATQLKGWSKEKEFLPLPFNQYTQIADLLLEPKDE